MKYPEDVETLKLDKAYILKAVSLRSTEDLKEFSSGYEKIVVNSRIKSADKQQLLMSSSLVKNSMVAYKPE